MSVSAAHLRRFIKDDPLESVSNMAMIIGTGSSVAAAGPAPASASDQPRQRRSVRSRAASSAPKPAALKTWKPSAERDARLVDAHPNTRKAMQRQRKCALCPLYFRESENIGQWRCRYHSRRLRRSDGSSPQRYECCDGTVQSAGCVECDHVEDRNEYADGASPLLLVPRFFLNSSQAVTRAPILASVLFAPDVKAELGNGIWQHRDFRDPADIRPSAEDAEPGTTDEDYVREYTFRNDPLLVLRVNHFRLPCSQ